MSEKLEKDFRNWLTPMKNFIDLVNTDLDEKQLKIAKSNPGSITGNRRIKGPAGSGKSIIAAVRAAELANKGRKVLVVSYNITLLHYLRMICYSYASNMNDFTDRIDWFNFHMLCKRIVSSTLGSGRYKSCFDNSNLEHTLSVTVPKIASDGLRLLGKSMSLSYDAILVDEGQDFSPNWWQLLTQMKREKGEMMLIGDWTQDIYSNGPRWNIKEMGKAGFKGNWNELKISYRMPYKAAMLARDYVEEYLNDNEMLLPKPPIDSANLSPCSLRWNQLDKPNNAIEITVNEIFALYEKAEPDWLAIPDVTFLVDNKDDGLMIVSALKEKNVNVVHTFSEDEEERELKFNFVGERGLIRGTTVHSFKGWESRAVVVLLRNAYKTGKRLLFIAMTRLKNDLDGSYLSIVNCAPEFRSFGKNFPEYLEVN